ncbi:MAG: ATP-binding protein [Nocardiopsaceae bacterium]|nr:ATP-binding protein [Nocardiopsaceae bacterium]
MTAQRTQTRATPDAARLIATGAVAPCSAAWAWLQVGPECLAAARAAVRGALARWDLEAVADEVTLMASELAANACVHGAPPVTLRLELRTGPAGPVLTCEVTDAGPGRPAPAATPAGSEHGRGLAVVAALADEWGTRPRRPGTAAWFRLIVPAGTGPVSGKGRAA